MYTNRNGRLMISTRDGSGTYHCSLYSNNEQERSAQHPPTENASRTSLHCNKGGGESNEVWECYTGARFICRRQAGDNNHYYSTNHIISNQVQYICSSQIPIAEVSSRFHLALNVPLRYPFSSARPALPAFRSMSRLPIDTDPKRKHPSPFFPYVMTYPLSRIP